MLASNLLSLAGIACLVTAVTKLEGWPIGVLVLGGLLLLAAYALYTQSIRDESPETEQPPEPAAFPHPLAAVEEPEPTAEPTPRRRHHRGRHSATR